MRIAVTSVFIALLFGGGLAALPHSSHAAGTTPSKIIKTDDDGTYKTVIVKSIDACTQLCRAEAGKCRGSKTMETMVTQGRRTTTTIECSLNNGLSDISPFRIEPPTPLSLDIALAELNAYRAENGLNALKLNAKLNQASRVHAQDLATHGFAGHTGTDGSSHADRVQRQSYYFSVAAENVATGQKSWDKVFQAWKDSPGHDANLLAEGVTDFGIALIYEPKTKYITYWTMLVAAPLQGFVHPAGAMTVEQKTMLEAQEQAAQNK